jgi:hypothetical protein
MMQNEKLEDYLKQHGVAWAVIPASRHAALENDWHSSYGKVWDLGLRYKHGVRAQAEYAQQTTKAFVIIPFLGDSAGPHSIGKRTRTAAYECLASSDLPDLSEFANMDFFISPPDLSWTMLHTHEDQGFGGPYFVQRKLLVPPARKRDVDQ